MFSLPALPYAHDALSPTISEETMNFHHDKHHAAYINTLNSLLEASGQSYDTLEAVIEDAAGKTPKKLFNNAAQSWNHAFFWECMTPEKAAPSGELADAIGSAFGGMDKLKEAFVTGGVDQFGSGWVWLVADKSGALKVIATHDADNTLGAGVGTPLLVCDVWEHAYYLDYQNLRKGYLEAWFDALPNWTLAASQFAAAKGSGKAWTFADAGK
jgi:Fe-Mn family superoxide dismutase